ncbi:UNVERIFIED_CONTAM: hypothetical protein Cloal_0555 [Acetivibrio alkalicellulosi]
MNDKVKVCIEKLEKVIIEAIRTTDKYAFQDPAWEIIDEISEVDNPSDAIEPILMLVEKYPLLDYGGPGPFGSFLETYFNKGYEEKLIESIKRKPTEYTIFLLVRIANDTRNPKRQEYMELLKSHSENDCLSDQWKDIIRNYK